MVPRGGGAGAGWFDAEKGNKMCVRVQETRCCSGSTFPRKGHCGPDSILSRAGQTPNSIQHWGLLAEPSSPPPM